MFNRMKIYTVHIKPYEPSSERKPVFVKEGFNILAFLLTGFWALYHRLWVPMFCILAFNIFLASVLKGHVLSSFGAGVLQMGFNLLVGFQANDWLRTKLSHEGYILADISAADSLLRAEQRYFERALAAA